MRNLRPTDRQTLYFKLMLWLYAIAIIWTTVQAYARLEYSRTSVRTETATPTVRSE